MNIDIRADIASGRVISAGELNSYTIHRTVSLGDGVFVHFGLDAGQPVRVTQFPPALAFAELQA